MAGRIVLFGATGYTGRLAAESMVERGLKPVLAGRERVGELLGCADAARAEDKTDDAFAV